MIKTINQAVAVQKRRVKAERRGIAKAVRRFARRGVDLETSDGLKTYQSIIRNMPSRSLTRNSIP